jgi:phosphoribosylformimino-5-aminoimidazole carboxamide ribotide isomerase
LLEGPDLPLYERLVRLGRGTIIASGGLATVGDLQAVRELGAGGAIIGRALYERRLSLRDALAEGRD